MKMSCIVTRLSHFVQIGLALTFNQRVVFSVAHRHSVCPKSKFEFSGEITLDSYNWSTYFEIGMSKSRSVETKMWKSFLGMIDFTPETKRSGSILCWCVDAHNAQYTPPTPTRLNCRVESCRRCVRTSRQSWPSFQFSAPVTYRLQNCKLGHDSRRVCAYHRHNSTRLNSTG